VIRVAAALGALGICVGAAVAARPPQSQALADGCAGGTAWAYVGDAALGAEAPAPGPQWASGAARVRPDGADLVLDVPGGNLAGTLNPGGRLELRREATPLFAWPEQGDRVTALGSWVWNCATGATELNPFRALWVQRAFSPRSATGEAEADLYVSPEAPASALAAECAHTTKSDLAAFPACLATPRSLDVAGDYTFTLAAPPKPKGAGPLRVRVVDQGGGADPTVEIVGGTARVTLHLTAGVLVAKQVFLGWADVPKAALPEHLKVRLRSLVLRGGSGPWRLYWSAAGLWSAWNGRGKPIVDVYVPRRTPWRVSAAATGGLEGAFSDRYSTAEVGLGLHHGLPPDYQLDYVVTRVG
jgi:hypothetical protein